MLAALLLGDGEALAGHGVEAEDAVAGCQGVASDLAVDASDLGEGPLVQVKVVLEGGLYCQSGDLCINNKKDVTDKIYKNIKITTVKSRLK